MFGQCGLGRPIAVTVAAAAIGWLAASSSAGAATKLVRTPEGDTCGQANSAPQQSLPAVIAACDVVVTQAQGRDLGLFHRYRGRALDRSGQSALALPEYDRALEILADDYDTLMWRAALREAVGDKSGAIADYQRLNRLNSRISDWRRAIARLGGTAESPPANEVAGVSPPAGSDEARPPQGKPLQPETRTALQSAQESPPATAGRAQSSAQSTAYQDQLKELGFYEDLDAANATADASGTVEPERQATERFELVRRAQTELTRLGYDIGEIDGVAGSRTRNALRSWLQSTGQPTSREIDPQLVAELEQTRSPEPQQVVEAETKSLESATADNAKPTPLTPEEPVSEPAQLPSQGAMIAATGQQPRDSAAVEPERPEPQSTSPVVLPTDGEKRVALVIGNSGYRNVAALRNPRQDAEDMAKALADIGFTVFPGYDLDRDAMDDLTTKFAREAADADLAVAYYSGHALQYSGENLLVPVDGRLEDQYSLRRLVRLDQLIQDTGGARKLAVVIVDACRDDPLAGRQSATRSLAIPKGLAQPGYVPPRTLVAYATSPGMVAYDGSGRNSPYVSALLRHIKTPGVKVQDMFAAVTGDVARETKDAQRPGTYSSLDAEAVYLVPSAPAATGVELSELTHAEVQAIQLSLSWLGFWSGNADGVVSPTLLDAVHRWQGSQSAGVADTMTTAEIVALHRRAARSRPREPLPPIGNMNQLLRQVQQGDAEAQRLLGMVNDPAFEAGPWPKDRQSAREWYKSAATEGDAEAAARLGLMLASPSGSAADQPEARQWLGKAAQSGQTEAALRLAELLLDEGESSPARAQAIELLKTAAASPATEGFANALLRDLGYQVVVSSNP